MPNRDLTLSLDIGTSSSRAILWNLQAVEIPECTSQIQYEMQTSEEGGSEIEAELILQHISQCLDQAAAKWGERAQRIAAVGISSFWHGLLALDRNFRPLTPIMSWADTRSADIAEILRNSLDQYQIHQRTGCVLHPSYYPARLIWYRDNLPDLFKRAAHWVSPGEYICWRLFGADGLKLSVSMASGTGLMNQAECDWDRQLLQELKCDESILTSISKETTLVQGLLPEFAQKWPALKNVPFLLPVGDGACGNIGSGCTSSRSFAINLGTSGAIRVLGTELKDDFILPKGLWRYRADNKRSLIGAAFSDGGNLIRWMQRTLQLPPLEKLETVLQNRTPCSHGLTILPFLAGERSMGWNSNAEGTIGGLKLNTSQVDIAQACMESVALRFALACAELKKLFPESEEIVVSGGALSRSKAWAQIFADALGRPLSMAAESEASSRGAAVLAMEAVGLIPDITIGAAAPIETVTPVEAHHKLLMDSLNQQQSLYKKLFGT